MVMVMEVGFIGLGRMGSNMAARMLESKKISVTVYDVSKEKVNSLIDKGAKGADSINNLIVSLDISPRIVWLMLPAGRITETVFQEVKNLLSKGDIIIDGANSQFQDTLRRHKEAEEKGIEMLDVGVSGGIIAAKYGYPMMIGGKKEIYGYCKFIFDSFGREEGYSLVGGPGTGHYVKMIHNAIEYGMMQAIAEGFDLLKNGRFKNLDLPSISHIWNHGTIIESFLMGMVENALNKSSHLDYLEPFVDDSSEGRWAATEAMEHAVPFVVNTYALHSRYISRDSDSMAFKMLAAMRNEFGGHDFKEQKK